MKRVIVFPVLLVLAASAWSQDREADSLPQSLYGVSIEPGYFYQAYYHPAWYHNGGLEWSIDGPGIGVGLEQGVLWARWFRTAFLLEFDVSYWYGGPSYEPLIFAGRVSAVLGFALGSVLIEPMVGLGFPDVVSAGIRVGVNGLPMLLQARVGGWGTVRCASLGVVLRLGT